MLRSERFDTLSLSLVKAGVRILLCLTQSGHSTDPLHSQRMIIICGRTVVAHRHRTYLIVICLANLGSAILIAGCTPRQNKNTSCIHHKTNASILPSLFLSVINSSRIHHRGLHLRTEYRGGISSRMALLIPCFSKLFRSKAYGLAHSEQSSHNFKDLCNKT
ncbi:hypothetical protein D5086_011992 [Populus alba]|uniref:Uncharacterized protein n=1 Tax=Populus alba TaxID=43335 RepID=A0ACC4C2F7_POPAL